MRPRLAEPVVGPPGAVVDLHVGETGDQRGTPPDDGFAHLGAEVGGHELLDVGVDVRAGQHRPLAGGPLQVGQRLRPLLGHGVERLRRGRERHGDVGARQRRGQRLEGGTVPLEVDVTVGLQGGRRLDGLDPGHGERGGVAVRSGGQAHEVGEEAVELAIGPVERDGDGVDGGRRAQAELVAREGDGHAAVDLAAARWRGGASGGADGAPEAGPVEAPGERTAAAVADARVHGHADGEAVRRLRPVDAQVEGEGAVRLHGGRGGGQAHAGGVLLGAGRRCDRQPCGHDRRQEGSDGRPHCAGAGTWRFRPSTASPLGAIRKPSDS